MTESRVSCSRSLVSGCSPDKVPYRVREDPFDSDSFPPNKGFLKVLCRGTRRKTDKQRNSSSQNKTKQDNAEHSPLSSKVLRREESSLGEHKDVRNILFRVESCQRRLCARVGLSSQESGGQSKRSSRLSLWTPQYTNCRVRNSALTDPVLERHGPKGVDVAPLVKYHGLSPSTPL